MTKDIITSVIILLLLIAFALWSIARNIKESIVDVTFAIEKMSAEIIRRTRTRHGSRSDMRTENFVLEVGGSSLG